MATHTPFSPPTESFWLFAYGSLMWQTDFPFIEQHLATIYGYHRALCIYSWTYRGTEQNPGLVFGLDEGGMTQGIVFKVSTEDSIEVYEKIHDREMVSNVYQPEWVSCQLDDGADATLQALAYVADHSNQQYAGALSDDDTVRLVQAGHGNAGPCTDYVLNTDAHLREIGVCDPMLQRIAGKL